ncbi:MAG: LPS export ABC transporter permease LptF [Alphaproteobacteria bacterium]
MIALQRYITRQLIIATLFIGGILICIVSLIRSLRLVDFVVNRGLPPTVLLKLTSLLIPSFLTIVLPIALFSATLFVYNKLVNDSELVIMRTAGMSQQALAKPALFMAIIVTLFGYGLQLYWLPLSYGGFKDLRYSFQNTFANVLLQQGRFNTPVDGVTVYVRAREKDGDLLGIFVHDTRIPERPVTIMAERGALVTTETGARVVMFNGNRQEIDTETGRLVLLYFDQNSIDLSVFDNDAEPRWRDPQERFIGGLLNPGDSAVERFYRTNLIAEAHRRLSSPLLIFAFVAIALASLLSGEFSRRGQNKRILIAVGAVVLLQSIAIALANITTKSLALVPFLYLLPIGAVLAALLMLVRRPPRRNRFSAIHAQDSV